MVHFTSWTVEVIVSHFALWFLIVALFLHLFTKLEFEHNDHYLAHVITGKSPTGGLHSTGTAPQGQ